MVKLPQNLSSYFEGGLFLIGYSPGCCKSLTISQSFYMSSAQFLDFRFLFLILACEG